MWKPPLRLRPLTGPDGREVGVFLPLERTSIRSAAFADPDPHAAGDATGVGVLFDAARLSLRAGAAPFRSLGRITVTPRPYQFVPLIMALRLDPVRLLIADDVGVGKTVEAAMVARELLDRGAARRLGVLCPAHLCDQWVAELGDRVAIEAQVVRPSSVARLERDLPRQDLTIYEHYPHLVASIDFVKTERRVGEVPQPRPPLRRHLGGPGERGAIPSIDAGCGRGGGATGSRSSAQKRLALDTPAPYKRTGA